MRGRRSRRRMRTAPLLCFDSSRKRKTTRSRANMSEGGACRAKCSSIASARRSAIPGGVDQQMAHVAEVLAARRKVYEQAMARGRASASTLGEVEFIRTGEVIVLCRHLQEEAMAKIMFDWQQTDEQKQWVEMAALNVKDALANKLKRLGSPWEGFDTWRRGMLGGAVSKRGAEVLENSLRSSLFGGIIF